MYLIEILHQTTTPAEADETAAALYLIEILHQTTTMSSIILFALLLYLIEILHQTTTPAIPPALHSQLYLIEILHQTTTLPQSSLAAVQLYLIEILHQTTTDILQFWRDHCCILSKFYIKPQLVRNYYGYSQVVSYRNSTSNHNLIDMLSIRPVLYLIEILHQTTTAALA